MTYRLVPLSGNTGTQLVSGKQDALEIAEKIARRERCHVRVTREHDSSHVTTIEPYPSLYGSDCPAGTLPPFERLAWWCRRHARDGYAAALPMWLEMFAEGRRYA